MTKGVRIMTFKNVAGLALLLVLIALGIHWYLTRPTVQEHTLTDFFQEFRMGRYTESEAYTSGHDFYQMAAETSVRDTDGSEYFIKEYFPENRRYILQSSVENFVRPHIARWKYLSMETQNLTDDSAIVHFRIELAIRDFTGGSLLAAEIHEGRIEGDAYMVLEDAEWRVEHFEFDMFSDKPIRLSDYLRQAH